jgi:hypothetical protein
MRKRTVVILGAGASIPFYSPPLTTERLTEAIKDKDLWSDLIRRYSQISDGVDEICASAIYDLLNCLQPFSTDLNFEDIVEVADKVSSYGFGIIVPKIDHVLIKVLKGSLPAYPIHSWAKVPFLFRQLIAEQVENYQNNCRVPEYKQLIDRFAGFLQSLVSTEDISVISLNYDDVLPDALAAKGLPLEDGFRTGRFSARDFLQGESVVSFLHGHARFVMDDSGVRRVTNTDAANKERLQNLRGVTGAATRYLMDGPNSYYFNTFIVTARDKDSSFNVNPFAAYYQRLALDLLTARRIIVAGFSFRDPDIGRLLVNFRSLRDGNEIVVVDFDPNPIDMVSAFTNTTSLIHQLFKTFSIDSLPLRATHNNLSYRYDVDIERVNRDGFGVLLPGLKYCKSGFEVFLRNYTLVLN